VLKKPGIEETARVLCRAVECLADEGIDAVIEPSVATAEAHLLNFPENARVFTWDPSQSKLIGRGIDLVVTLGGDGTILFASSSIGEDVPPVLAFAMGTLGFLTPFNTDDMQPALRRTLRGDVSVHCKQRMLVHLEGDYPAVRPGEDVLASGDPALVVNDVAMSFPFPG